MCTTITYAINYGNAYEIKNNQTPSMGMYSTSYYQDNNPRLRKVKGYTENGDSINTDNDGKKGNPNPMWEDGYSYYYNDGYWYRNGKDGWKVWDTPWGWGWMLWDWQGGSDPGSGAIQYYKENPTPLGHHAILYMLAGIYIYRIRRKKNMLKLQTS